MSTATAGRRSLDGALELAELAVDAGQMADDLGDPHDRHIFRADNDFQAGSSHSLRRPCRRSGVPAPGSKPLLQTRQSAARRSARRWLRLPK